MIDKDFITKNLDPVVWSRLGELLQLMVPVTKKLHILTDQSKVIKACDTCRNIMDINRNIEMLNEDFANTLFANDDSLEEVWVYSLDALKEYYTVIQKRENYECDADHYLSYIEDSIEQSSGFHIFRRNPKKQNILRLLDNKIQELPPDSILLIQYKQEDKEFFHVILTIKNSRITQVETLDGRKLADFEKTHELPLYVWSFSLDSYRIICSNLEKKQRL